MVSKPEDFIGPASDIPILLKVGEYFILRREIRSVARFGKGSRILLHSGGELIVKINYDKVVELMK